MPRIRTTKPEHWGDKELVNISLQAHLLWIGSWNFSDDKGIFENDPMLIRSQVFPRRKDVRLEMVSQWLDQLVKARFIIPFDYNGQGYYITRTFEAHQRIDKPQPSKIPSEIITRIFEDHSKNDPGTVALYSSGKESNVKVEESGAPTAPRTPVVGEENGNKKKFIPPTQRQVESFFIHLMGDTRRERHWPEDRCRNEAGQMFDHYTMNGWVQGKGKAVRDWEAACRVWIRNCLKGVFEKPESIPREKKPEPRHETPAAPQLVKVQEELNYLYEKWLEDITLCTVISVTVEHYNFLKSGHLISFSEEEASAIKKLAQEHMKEKSLEGEIALTRLMKAYGVLEFFKQLKTQGKETVFNDPAAIN